MLTSAQIRQQFLDFFREKKHTIVPSGSLMPDSPNLLFTNAGMNQFVPIFLGEKSADVSKWGGAIPGSDTRAADTQKCIRAGGKHNDLDDVGLDTYHHTFFEMLGNWSFGDYFKKEAIEWAWELVVERWGFPANRVYATVYNPDKSIGDPAERDAEAWELWAGKFRAAGLDPAVHIVDGNKKDNFWMMGETGPCGPCSELHIDLTPAGDTRGALVNQGVPECIEIWNLVFIQFNANADGTFSPLPAQHVDTGMGFERVTSIIQGTKNFTDFANVKISNYETDIFRPLFDELEKMSGMKYTSTLPGAQDSSLWGQQASCLPEDSGQDARRPHSQDGCAPAQIAIDVAFRVIADHIRTLSFAIADRIQPGNTDRNYVLRRILRRAVRYGRTLGFQEPFFYKLVAVLARTMGDVFPEIRAKQKHVEETLRREEEAFNRTLDKGMALFESEIAEVRSTHALWSQEMMQDTNEALLADASLRRRLENAIVGAAAKDSDVQGLDFSAGKLGRAVDAVSKNPKWSERVFARLHQINDQFAFKLYDTYGFPLDLTELMARERGLTVDTAGFEVEMEKQRARARAAQKKQVIELSEVETKEPTRFVGYDAVRTPATVSEVVSLKGKTIAIFDQTVCYAEMGGQVGDTGEIADGGQLWNILNTQKTGNTWLHFIEPVMGEDAPAVGADVMVSLDEPRRAAIQRHHTVTHLLHWALHEVVSREATQKGSFVGPDKLTFDFNSAALTPQQVRDVERLVNARIVENAGVTWTEERYADVRGRADVMQFFGDKYGETVRLVDIAGFSKELCAGTHTRATGEIGLFRIESEAAIAAGVRRIEAVAGLNAYDFATADMQRLHALAAKMGSPLADLEKRIEGMLAQQKELEKALKAAQQREAAGRAKELLAKAETVNGTPCIIQHVPQASGDELQSIADAVKGQFFGVVVLSGVAAGQAALLATVSPELTSKFQAGKIIQAIAPLVGGKGGGRPDSARGAGKDVAKVLDALAHARTLLG